MTRQEQEPIPAQTLTSSREAAEPFSRLNRIGYQIVRAIARVTAWPYFRLRIEGAEHLPPGPVIVAPNHCSYIDPLVLQAVIPSHRIVFMMTSDWYDVKSIQPFFRFMKCISVEEGARNRKALEEALGMLRLGASVGIFPEGQIGPEGKLGEFSPGVASL